MSDKRRFQFCIHGCDEGAPAPGAKRIKRRLTGPVRSDHPSSPSDDERLSELAATIGEGALLSPTPLSLQSRSEILELPGPGRRSRYLPADSPEKRILAKPSPPLLPSRLDSSRC